MQKQFENYIFDNKSLNVSIIIIHIIYITEAYLLVNWLMKYLILKLMTRHKRLIISHPSKLGPPSSTPVQIQGDKI